MSERLSKLGTLNLRLADWVDPGERYTQRFLPVDPQSEQAAGDIPSLLARPEFRIWRARNWRGGEGQSFWERGTSRFRQSRDVRPLTGLEDGFELGPLGSVTEAAAGGTFNDGRVFGVGQGKLWVGDDGDAYEWDPAAGNWKAAISTGGLTEDMSSIADGDDTWLYSGHHNGTIRRWKSGSDELHHNAFSDPPVVASFNGVLYALDGDDLYTVDKTAANTRELVADFSGSSSVYRASEPWSYRRLAVSDKGPIWLRRLDNGQTFVEHYNPFLNRQETLGRLPVDFAFPYSIAFANGFVFVGFRYAPDHATAGDAYVWYKRGGLEGVAGPIRSISGSTASKPVLIGGTIGAELIIGFDRALWAYNLATGGIYLFSLLLTSGTPQHVVTFGQEAFVAGATSGGNTQAVARVDATKHYAGAGTFDGGALNTGRVDFDYPGLMKALLDVTVITDPLPANTKVSVNVAPDIGSATILGESAGTGETRHVFTASSTTKTLKATNFEIVVIIETTNSSVSPVVREVSARATGAAHVREVVMEVDCSQDVGRQSRASLITGLKALAETNDVVTFTDKFGVEAKSAATGYDVTVEEVILPEVQGDHNEKVSASVRVRQVALT